MSCVNPNDSLFKILLKKVKNPLLAEIEFDKQSEGEPVNKAEASYDKALIKNAGNDVSKIFENYLAQFGITVKDINEVKDKLNIDEVGYADILSKIAFVKDRKNLPEIAGEFIAYMMKHNGLVKDIILDFAKNDAKLKIKKSAIYYVASGLGKSVLAKKNPNKFVDMDDLLFKAVKNITGLDMNTMDASMELNKNEDVGKELVKLIEAVSDTKIILSPLNEAKIKNLGLTYKKFFVPSAENIPNIIKGISERSTNPYDIDEELYNELYVDRVSKNKNVFQVNNYIENEFENLSTDTQNLEEFLDRGDYVTTNNYSDLLKDQDYFKRIGILIANELQGRYDISNDKSLVSKIKKIISKFFGLFKKSDVTTINKNIGIIVDNVVKQNKNFITASIYKPGAEGKITKPVSIKQALLKDEFGKKIIYKLSQKGFILTGSTALSEQGTILRPNENPLHDIDWVSPFSREETDKIFKEVYPDAIFVRDIQDVKGGYTTDSYLIAPEGYEIKGYEAKKYGDKIIIDSYSVVDKKTEETVGTYALEFDEVKNKMVEKENGVTGKVIDFFSYEDYQKSNKNEAFEFVTSDKVSIKLANWKDIFAAKLKFARYKDIWDYNRFVPNENIQEIDEEINDYITKKVIKNFGIAIPGKDSEPLVPKAETDKFNNAVMMNNNILPSEFFTGINNVHNWKLNKKNLYNLVDKDTKEIYLRDVNLKTGYMEEGDVIVTPINVAEQAETIDSVNNSIEKYRLDEILAEKGYDANDIISNLEAATTQEELNKIINKLLKLIC
jgi:hypothetical protein